VFQKSGLQRWVNETCRLHKPKVAVICSSNVADYVLNCPDKPQTVIVDFADVDSEKWRNYRDSATPPKSWIYAIEASRVAAAEDRITRNSSYVSFVTHDETAMFQKLHPAHAAKAVAIGSGVDTAYYDPALTYPRLVPEKPTFVFTGTMDYWPNEQAVEWFVHKVLRPLHTRGIDAQFIIVGSRPGKTVQALSGERGVIITGRVPDVMPYLAHADAVVCPMQIARGIQNKVLEGMAMGRPVIASLGALTGIEATPGKHLLQADTPAEWIETCVQLLGDPQRSAAIGAAARARILEEFSWTARLGTFNKLIDTAGQTS
jgi:polysaccharide biosynthesis protein PslH